MQYKDGDIIAGSDCIIDGETGKTTLEAGKIYLRGCVRDIERTEFTIPTNTTVRIGVYYLESTITELEDPTLRDPAVGTRNYQEVGQRDLKLILFGDFRQKELLLALSMENFTQFITLKMEY